MSTSEHRKNVRISLGQRHRDLREPLTASSNNMDADVKKEWVKALRSGKYEQGHGKLCRVDAAGTCSFCCLGVLADEAIDADWYLVGACYRLGPAGPTGRLRSSDMEMLGLSKFAHYALSSANDLGLPFSTIADAIEECL